MIDASIGKAFLEHYGVKGMRWGVRRSDAELARAGSKKSDDDDDSSGKSGGQNSRSKIGKDTATMSDKELKAVVNRMNMEQQYARLAPKSIPQKAVSFVEGIVKQAAQQQLSQLANQQLNRQIGSLMARPSNAPALPRLTTPPDPAKRVTG